ncbi:MAG: ABC transporter permease [Blautia sp.]|nr:ABC transporter permease [Blautia sp.]
MFENIRLAFQGIWSHKMRSFLTMLGIIIGIASIIAIVSTIKGTTEQIKEDLIGSGNNTVNITLYDGDNEYDPEWGNSAAPPILTTEIKEKVRKLDNVVSATFFYNRSFTSSVYYQNTAFSGGKVYGVDSSYLDTCGYQVQSGRGFVDRDFAAFSKVAIVDNNAAENLFGGENPVGKTIEIGQEPFTVVGLVRQKDDYLPKINSLSEFDEYFQTIMGCVMIPDKCWPVAFKFDEPMNAVIKADSTDNMSTAGNAAADTLNTIIPSTAGKRSSYAYKADDVMQKVRDMQNLSRSTNQQLIFIAAISLLVGGIGVMNIMLVTVTERTKEIGLKKAIGARKNTIRAQFLTEASVLTSIGGVIGVVIGIGLSKILSKAAGTPSAISIPSIVIAVAFSTLIGLIFGLLPSVKASNLNPIDALRSE